MFRYSTNPNATGTFGTGNFASCLKDAVSTTMFMVCSLVPPTLAKASLRGFETTNWLVLSSSRAAPMKNNGSLRILALRQLRINTSSSAMSVKAHTPSSS